MYSSLWEAVTTDPVLMVLPLDDHMAHRGDGVFEALKYVNGRLYNLQAHLRRLEQSAAALRLTPPVSAEELVNLAVATVRAGGQRDGVLRIFLSRGPGGFSVSPFECPRPELYLVATALPTPFMAGHPEGARIGASAVPPKSGALALIKNCNYVPNVLMKMEARERGLDFTVGFDEHGFLTEGATENVGLVSRDGRLLFPGPDRALDGTTMRRVMALAEELPSALLPGGTAFADIDRGDLLNAREILLVGTTINVVAAVEFEGRPVADGKPGPIYRELSRRLDEDIAANTALHTVAIA